MRNVRNQRLTLAAAAAAALLTTAACGSGGPSASGGEGTTGSGEPQPIEWSNACGEECQEALTLEGDPADVDCTVGISQNSLKHPYGVAQKAALEDAASRNFPNMTVFSTDGQGDAITQSSQVRDLITRGIDVLVITPLEQDALVPVIKEAQEAGIKVVTHDRSVNTDVTVHIAANSVQAGETAGQYIVDQLGAEGGRIVEITGTLGASATNERHEGFDNVVSQHPNVEVVASQTADFQRDQGLAVMQDFLQRFGPGEIDAVYSHNDEMSLGALQAIEEAGRSDEMFVVGFDGAENAFEAIEAGDYAASVVYPLDAPEAIAAAAKACLGEEMPETVLLEGPLVTQENIADFVGTGF
ncbi:substrate-binding domain-containing protein [Geodermatophilus sp. SYSU D01186]